MFYLYSIYFNQCGSHPGNHLIIDMLQFALIIYGFKYTTNDSGLLKDLLLDSISSSNVFMDKSKSLSFPILP